jgi:hypothetical protein
MFDGVQTLRWIGWCLFHKTCLHTDSGVVVNDLLRGTTVRSGLNAKNRIRVLEIDPELDSARAQLPSAPNWERPIDSAIQSAQ